MRVPDLKEVWGYVRPRKPSKTQAKAEAAAPIEPLPELKTKAQLKPRYELEHKPQKHKPHPLNLRNVNPSSQTGTEVQHPHHRQNGDEKRPRTPHTPGGQTKTEPAAAKEPPAKPSPEAPYSDPRQVPEDMRTALDRHFIRAIEATGPSTPWEEVIKTETAKLIASKPSIPSNHHYILDLDLYGHEEVDENSPIARHYGSQWATKKYHRFMNGPERRSRPDPRQKQNLGKAAKVLDFEYREDVKGFMSRKSTSTLSKKSVVSSLSKKSMPSLSKKSISNLSTKSANTASNKQATASAGSSIKSTNEQATVSSPSASVQPAISTPTTTTAARPSHLPRPTATVQTIVTNINTVESNAKQQQQQQQQEKEEEATARARKPSPTTPTTPTPTTPRTPGTTTTTHTTTPNPPKRATQPTSRTSPPPPVASRAWRSRRTCPRARTGTTANARTSR
ncbi:hypothetical protein BO86DRAFT_21007 [Aspergillus japonicus CBS 114.51]|uniref:Uncharacterized protein n=1 Tax=Aspergillus japonicus CBS 114.51 TaxID=1448312 RepID=A0A8T8WKJ3_ASPJA|nr:hypothetical protein BO86DRAFT_21007 [Aspergillus japonicus CBS 114.51]RAH76277.1 hypothetical protein BO86DRAFT_21007 [Aspergillus japonicus CBS 114.51]